MVPHCGTLALSLGLSLTSGERKGPHGAGLGLFHLCSSMIDLGNLCLLSLASWTCPCSSAPGPRESRAPTQGSQDLTKPPAPPKALLLGCGQGFPWPETFKPFAHRDSTVRATCMAHREQQCCPSGPRTPRALKQMASLRV